jgi:hypothetical protein
MSSHDRGVLGEALTRADLEQQGYTIVAERMHVDVPGGHFVPDFIARTPDGHIVAVESKFGPGARYTQGQLKGYAYLDTPGSPLVMRSPEAKALMREFRIDHIDEVVTYRWNTRIVPTDALRARADEIIAEARRVKEAAGR